MSEAPAARWRRQLEQWELPSSLLDLVPDSPYEWSARLWKRRAAIARNEKEPPTTGIVRSLLPAGGSLLDVGAGAGRASLPLAAAGFRLTAIEQDPGMVAAFREEAETQGIRASVLEGTWPGMEVPVHDVVMCANVVYDVQDIEPFMAAMAAHALLGVVVELTANHPWSNLSAYYRILHDLDRPAGPTYQDFVAVVEALLGRDVHVELWTRPGQAWYESWEEILEYYGRRLVLPRARWGELRDLLAPEVTEDAGRLRVGPSERRLDTVWWAMEGV